MGTLTSVTWSVWLIGGPDGATGSHRVKLPGGGTNSSVQTLAGDTDHPNTYQWTSNTGLGFSVNSNGMTFHSPFWYVTWTKVDTGETSGRLIRGDLGSIFVGTENPDDLYIGDARVYYVWAPEADAPSGSKGYLYIDAYDASLKQFIPDVPWATVSTTPSWMLLQDPNPLVFTAIPYPGNPLSVAINDPGFVDTDAAIAVGEGVKVSARDLVDASGKTIKTFSARLAVYAAGAGVVAGTFVDGIIQYYPGDPRDSLLGHDSIAVLIAIYNDQRFVLERPGNFHPVGVEIYEIEALRGRQGEISQQLATFAQQMADQEERTATLTRRFDAVTASLMALSARVEALQKDRHIAETVTRLEEPSIAGEQPKAGPTVARRGFFARLFRRGR